MIRHHTATSLAAYHDLRQSLIDDQISDVRGVPREFRQGTKLYWYDTYRVGTSVKKRYIGEDSPQLRERFKRLEHLKADREERRKRRTRLVRILRAEGFLPVDAPTGQLLSAMARAGVFRLGGTVIGTHAFRLYEGELGVRFDFDLMAQTGDIDIASFERLALVLDDRVETPLADVLSDFEFQPVPGIDANRTWRWKQSKRDALVEFLTPSFTEDEGLRELPTLGVDAQSLHYLNYVLADPIKAVVLYRSGVLVQIPRPERFAIHKLIVSDRRRTGPDSLKSRKDALQAAFLIRVLAQDRPDELAEAWHDARDRGDRWCARLDSALGRDPQTAETLSRVVDDAPA